MVLQPTIIVQGGGGTDVSATTATAPDVLEDKDFFLADGTLTEGTMVDRGTALTDITTKAQEVTIAAGKHSGSGKVKISTTEQAKIIAGNIKSGVTLLGQAGSSTVKDVSDTTATAAGVAAGTYFYTAAGVRTEGTAMYGFKITINARNNDWPENNGMWIYYSTEGYFSYSTENGATWIDIKPTTYSSDDDETLDGYFPIILYAETIKFKFTNTGDGAGTLTDDTNDVTLRTYTTSNWTGSNIVLTQNIVYAAGVEYD